MGSRAATRKNLETVGFGTASSILPFLVSGDLQNTHKKKTQQTIDFSFFILCSFQICFSVSFFFSDLLHRRFFFFEFTSSSPLLQVAGSKEEERLREGDAAARLVEGDEEDSGGYRCVQFRDERSGCGPFRWRSAWERRRVSGEQICEGKRVRWLPAVFGQREWMGRWRVGK
jgi:hypothetical protein